MLMQWYDIAGVIGTIFVGFVAILALVSHLEQWLDRPESPNPVAPVEQELDEHDDRGLEPPGSAPIG
jgi:hypothetical protein